MRTKKRRVPDSSCIGTLFSNKAAMHPKAPNLVGVVELSEDFIQALLNASEDQDCVEVELSAWQNKAASTGQRYLTLKLKVRDKPVVNQKRINHPETNVSRLLTLMDDEDDL
jgi:hypothetical protein